MINNVENINQVCLTMSDLILPSVALKTNINLSQHISDEDDKALLSKSTASEQNFHNYTMFSSSGYQFIFDAFDGAQVVEASKIYRLPNVRNNVAGVINIRGSFIPVIDIPYFLGASTQINEKGKILLVGKDDKTVGIAIEGLPENLSLDQNNAIPLTELDEELKNAISPKLLPSILSLFNLSTSAKNKMHLVQEDSTNAASYNTTGNSSEKILDNCLLYVDSDQLFKTVINEAILN